MCANTTGSRAPAAKDPQPVLFTIAQAAEMLNLSEKTLRRKIAAREVPHRKLGPRQIRLSQSDIDAFLAASHVPARPPATVLTGRRKPA